ncbi:hypothetical protein ACWN8V_02215 [Vagococcus elongatus]|uniref:Uncharacterized protein n=1 Tax=Vagococcus elongatus TaxID=180344 RepID=A0A430B473_9ENTE|nr:hypothetical protein [Vagococcus elongatus]RSU15140.1 hypothetical protein CBF29_02065 [Vagococcus elongatus]
MKSEDEELEKQVDKSNEKRKFWTLLVLLFGIALVMIGAHMWHFNQGVFRGDKVAGVPDGQVLPVIKTEEPFETLFDLSGGIKFNGNCEKLSVYLDYYEKDQRKKHQELLVTSFSDKSECNGWLVWGVVSNKKKVEETLKINFFDTKGITRYGEDFDFSGLKLDWSVNARNFFEEDFQVEYPYILSLWNSEGTVSELPNTKDYFGSDYLKKTKQTAYLYVIFE